MDKAFSNWKRNLEQSKLMLILKLEFSLGQKSAKLCVILYLEPSWTHLNLPLGMHVRWWCKPFLGITELRTMLNLLATCYSLQETRLPDVTKNTFLTFSSGFFPNELGWCKRWAWRAISSRHLHLGNKVSRPLQSQHDGWLLLVSSAGNSGHSQAQEQVPKALLNSYRVKLETTFLNVCFLLGNILDLKTFS